MANLDYEEILNYAQGKRNGGYGSNRPYIGQQKANDNGSKNGLASKRPSGARPDPDAVRKFLQKKQQDEMKRMAEEKRKKEMLLAMRSQNTKSNKAAKMMASRTKDNDFSRIVLTPDQMEEKRQIQDQLRRESDPVERMKHRIEIETEMEKATKKRKRSKTTVDPYQNRDKYSHQENGSASKIQAYLAKAREEQEASLQKQNLPVAKPSQREIDQAALEKKQRDERRRIEYQMRKKDALMGNGSQNAKAIPTSMTSNANEDNNSRSSLISNHSVDKRKHQDKKPLHSKSSIELDQTRDKYSQRDAAPSSKIQAYLTKAREQESKQQKSNQQSSKLNYDSHFEKAQRDQRKRMEEELQRREVKLLKSQNAKNNQPDRMAASRAKSSDPFNNLTPQEKRLIQHRREASENIKLRMESENESKRRTNESNKFKNGSISNNSKQSENNMSLKKQSRPIKDLEPQAKKQKPNSNSVKPNIMNFDDLLKIAEAIKSKPELKEEYEKAFRQQQLLHPSSSSTSINETAPERTIKSSESRKRLEKYVESSPTRNTVNNKGKMLPNSAKSNNSHPKVTMTPGQTRKPMPPPPPTPRLKLPPIGSNYKRGMYEDFAPTYESEEEEEEDDEMKDFIDDGEDYADQHEEDLSKYIREIFGYDKRKYAGIDEFDIEEASFDQQMQEEIRSAKIGLLEDLEDMRKEKEEKKRKAKRKRLIIDDDDEDD